MQPDVWVVDDTELMRASMAETLSAAGYRVRTAADGEEVLPALDPARPAVVVCDLRMPRLGGLELLERLGSRAGEVAVVLVTAYGTVPSAVRAMKHGAVDFLAKPFGPEELERAVRAAHERLAPGPSGRARRQAVAVAQGTELVGTGRAISEVRERIASVARSGATVLVTGESGTGKEVVARLLHAASGRAGAMVCVNCAALSSGVLESELFGHERGAFTGADRQRTGRFELAQGGTLLLDEISEIAPNLQAKLLRVLQERRFERVGSSESIAADVRLVATSNRDLAREVAAGTFRQDLYFRLAVVSVELPPLRERREDLPALVEHLRGRLAAATGRDPFPAVSPRALTHLAGHDWPGNVRELANVLERAGLLHPGVEALEPEHLDLEGVGASPAGAAGRTLEEMEREAIASALRSFGGHRGRTARALGIAERTLRDKLRRWEVSAAPAAEAAGTRARAAGTGAGG